MKGTRQLILEQISAARRQVPDVRPASLPDARFEGVPDWHAHEGAIWEIGEEIRQLLSEATRLRKDPELQEAFAKLVADRRAGRGRQPFVMLLGYRACVRWAPTLEALLEDEDVAGHAIDALYKMRARGYAESARRLTGEGWPAWIRKAARRYIQWDES